MATRSESQTGRAPVQSGWMKRWGDWVACLILLGGIAAVYWPVKDFQFLNCDDTQYVTAEPHVQAGISWSGLKWAFTANVAANWHPLTLLSHMLDCQIHGLSPRWPHIENVLLHAANSLLLFAFLQMTTHRRWPAFFVAALFAWHPLHVESVAWVAERKDVLSTFFWMLTLIAYAAYVRDSKIDPSSPGRLGGRKNRRPTVYYILSLFCFMLGLLTKPMLVTLPCVMLLMDYWPLNRLKLFGGQGAATPNEPVGWTRLLLEKVPLFLLAGGLSFITMRTQASFGAVVALETLPLERRIANAMLSYYWYIGKNFWPVNMAVYYPYRDIHLFNWLTWLAAAGLILISAVTLWLRKTRFVAVGWFWFVGTLVPVIGLVQVGSQGMADRYMYIPSVGLFILVVYGSCAVAARFPEAIRALEALGVCALAGCIVVTAGQVKHWRDSETLFKHAIEVTKDNFVAYNNLASYYYAHGKNEDAAKQLSESLRIFPGYANAHYNLGNAYASMKQPRKAIEEYETTLRLNPKLKRVQYLLANQFLAIGDLAKAAEHYKAEALLSPDDAAAHYQLANVFAAQNDIGGADREFKETIRLSPDWPEALNNYSWFLATQPDGRYRNGTEAVKLASHAVSIVGTNDAGMMDTLAAAYAESAQFTNAIKTATAAANAARGLGKTTLANDIESRQKLYEKSEPYRDDGTSFKLPSRK